MAREDYVLGRNVTEQLRAREVRDTVVLSFRLSSVDFDALSDLAESQGKTVSQVGREAVQASLIPSANLTGISAAIGLPHGAMAYFGDPWPCTYGSDFQVELRQ